MAVFPSSLRLRLRPRLRPARRSAPPRPHRPTQTGRVGKALHASPSHCCPRTAARGSPSQPFLRFCRQPLSLPSNIPSLPPSRPARPPAHSLPSTPTLRWRVCVGCVPARGAFSPRGLPRPLATAACLRGHVQPSLPARPPVRGPPWTQAWRVSPCHGPGMPGTHPQTSGPRPPPATHLRAPAHVHAREAAAPAGPNHPPAPSLTRLSAIPPAPPRPQSECLRLTTNAPEPDPSAERWPARALLRSEAPTPLADPAGPSLTLAVPAQPELRCPPARSTPARKPAAGGTRRRGRGAGWGWGAAVAEGNIGAQPQRARIACPGWDSGARQPASARGCFWRCRRSCGGPGRQRRRKMGRVGLRPADPPPRRPSDPPTLRPSVPASRPPDSAAPWGPPRGPEPLLQATGVRLRLKGSRSPRASRNRCPAVGGQPRWGNVGRQRPPVHGWFSGRILACHAGGPGSIPGPCNSSVLFWSRALALPAPPGPTTALASSPAAHRPTSASTLDTPPALASKSHLVKDPALAFVPLASLFAV